MACESPLMIRNKAVNFRPNIDKLYNRANCGHCPSCKKEKRDNWYVRARFEMCDCLGQNKDMEQVGEKGFILFPTLTYSRDSRPRKQVMIGEQPIIIDGFSHKHIHKFTNQVTDRIRDKYHLDKEQVALRYLIASEYGYNETYIDSHQHVRVGEAAPHYHALLFFPSVCAADKDYWKDYVKSIWESQGNGFCNYSRKFGPFVESAKPLIYVTEYINKQTDWYQREDLHNFLYQDVPAPSTWTPENRARYQILVNARKEEIKDILPNHWQSLHFGESMSMYLRDLPQEKRLSIFKNGISFADDLSLSGKVNTYAVPYYVYKKLYLDQHKIYTIDKDGYHHTKVDKEWFNSMFQDDARFQYFQNLYKAADNFRHTMLELNIRFKYPDSRIESYLGKKFDLHSCNDLVNFFKTIQEQYSAEYICSYKQIRDHSFTSMYHQKFECASDSDFVDYVADFYFDKIKRTKFPNIIKDADPFIIWHGKKSLIPDRDPDMYMSYINTDLDKLLDVLRTLSTIDSHDRISEYTHLMIEKRTYKQTHLTEYIL